MAAMGEVDRSSQFESVKKAVNRFGGGAPVVTWQKADVAQFQFRPEEIELMKVEERTVKLEMELFVKERETFKVLKELQSTKQRINALNSEIEKETKFMNKPLALQINEEKMPVFLNFYKEILAQNSKRSPNSTLIELQQAKVNLNKTNIQILKEKIQEEKLLMEKTREKIRLKTDKAASLEKDLNKITMEIQNKKNRTQSDIQAQIKEINSQREKHQKMSENYKSEISQLISQIEQAKSKTKIIEVRYFMAKKMKEASNSAEKLALSKLETLNPNSNSEITLSAEDHAELIYKAQEADKISQNKIETAMKILENANKSKKELLERVEEAMIDVQTSKKALNAALKREEIANKHKLEAEEALRRWRSNYHNTPHYNNHKKLIHNSTKFKNSVLPPKKCGNNLLDVNGLSLVKKTGPNISIGQILNIKLMGPDERERKSMTKVKSSTKPKVSLGQILSQNYDGFTPLKIDDSTCQSKLPSKKKKLGFVILTLLMAKQRRKKKKQGFGSKVV